MKEILEKNKYKIIITILVILIIIGLVIYLSIDFSRKRILKNHLLLYKNEEIKIGSESFPDSEHGIQYTFSCCLRIENIAGNSAWLTEEYLPKTIIFNNGSPNIMFLRNSNTVIIEIAYKDVEGVNNTYSFELDSFDSQIWKHLCITVDNRYVKVFLNGKIHTAKKIPSAPWKSNRVMSIGESGNNFNGYVGFIDYYNRVLSLIILAHEK